VRAVSDRGLLARVEWLGGPQAMVIVVMGVMGSGKTALARALARGLGAQFFDADDAHASIDRDRMARGEPLDEAAREPWLRAVARVIAERARDDLVVACSALRRRHRDVLRRACPELRLVFLRASASTLRRRVADRRGHFASPSLLDAQLATLEPPDPDEGAIVVDNEDAIETVAARVLAVILDEWIERRRSLGGT
jgi:gluconokinase